MRSGLKAILSILIVFAAVYDLILVFNTWSLPFSITLEDGHTMTISAAPGIPLPAPLQAGDRIDLDAVGYEARTTLDVIYNARALPAETAFSFPIRRGDASFVTSVTTVPLPPTRALRVVEATTCTIVFIIGCIALLLLWRGRDRAAAAMVVWASGFVVGLMFNYMPIVGTTGLAALLFSQAMFLVSRTGFYLMAELLVAPLLSARARFLFRAAFILMMILGGAQTIGGTSLYALTGYAELMLPRYTVFFSWIYAVPVAMLLVGVRAAPRGEGVRLGWVALAGICIIAAVTITNAVPYSFITTYTLSALLFTFAACVVAYALLRHRLVDVSIVIDRALVYGLVTTLVVGVVAAVNSVVLREALPPGAGLALQVIVPLALGIVLGRVREYLDRVVERVFFRSKYLAEKALRTFARHVGHYDAVAALIRSAAEEIEKRTSAPGVAIYSIEAGKALLVKECGDAAFPASLETDDPALVALRAEHRAVDLEGPAEGALGADGCALPMMVLGNLRGIVVLRNRPGEHYGSDEKKLLLYVAREVGAAWRILRARDNEALVLALAEGEVATIKAARDKARALALAWAGA